MGSLFCGRAGVRWRIRFAALATSLLLCGVAGQAAADDSSCLDLIAGAPAGAAPKLEPNAATARNAILYGHCVLQHSLVSPHREELRGLAGDTATDALAGSGSIGDPQLRAEIVGRLLELALDAGNVNEGSLLPYVEGLRRASARDPSFAAYAMGLEGRIYLAAGDPRASESLQQAIAIESTLPFPMRLPDWYLALSETSSDRHDEYVHAAFVALDGVRPLLPRRDPITDESYFSLHVRKMFEAEIDAELAKGVPINPELLSHAQNVVEAYREAEIRSAFANCVASLARIQPAALRKSEIVLYPILLKDRIELLMATGGDNNYRRLDASHALNRETIVPLIEHVRDAVIGNKDDGWQDDAKRLYAALIAPVEGQLNGDTTLVIVPDGPLRLLPFATLIAGDGKYLIEHTRIAIAPALSYTEPGDDNSGRNAWTVAAYVNEDVPTDDGVYKGLTATADEAKAAVGETESGGSTLGEIIANFRLEQLQTILSAKQVNVLHLATHASFRGRSDASYLVARDGILRLETLRSWIEARHSRGEAIDLLVLSACETALGDDEASMGFAGTAVQAGARSVLASLWPVNDRSTDVLMTEFYRHYRAGTSRAGSLQLAQQKLISGGGEYAAPYYWAAFTTIGAWR